MSRQIVLDTETTGLDPKFGHRIIEIGCIELMNRRVTENHFHFYLQPDREIDNGAIAVHGITNEFLKDKPRFEIIVEDFLKYIDGAELIIHNAPFDVGFINAELKRVGKHLGQLEDYCGILDTLTMARERHPGQKNSLDALCKRYEIDNTHRTLHGALLDSRILVDVYLTMTGGQGTISFGSQDSEVSAAVSVGSKNTQNANHDVKSVVVVQASEAELKEHEDWLKQHSAA